MPFSGRQRYELRKPFVIMGQDHQATSTYHRKPDTLLAVAYALPERVGCGRAARVPASPERVGYGVAALVRA